MKPWRMKNRFLLRKVKKKEDIKYSARFFVFAFAALSKYFIKKETECKLINKLNLFLHELSRAPNNLVNFTFYIKTIIR